MDLHAHVPAVDLVIIPPQGYFRHSPQFVPLPGSISSTPVPISPNTLVPVLPSPTCTNLVSPYVALAATSSLHLQHNTAR